MLLGKDNPGTHKKTFSVAMEIKNSLISGMDEAEIQRHNITVSAVGESQAAAVTLTDDPVNGDGVSFHKVDRHLSEKQQNCPSTPDENFPPELLHFSEQPAF